MRTLTVIPAYGRDYKTAKAVKEAWEADLDFLIQDVGSPDNERYINKQDAEVHLGPGTIIKFRYNNLRDVLVIALPRNPSYGG